MAFFSNVLSRLARGFNRRAVFAYSVNTDLPI